jgi:Peptidase family M13
MTFPSGIPIDELDPGIRPQDDLFRHVNGRWLARTTIPADRARDSTFRILAEEAENAVREIVEQAVSAPEGSEERKFGDVYARPPPSRTSRRVISRNSPYIPSSQGRPGRRSGRSSPDSRFGEPAGNRTQPSPLAYGATCLVRLGPC